MKNHMVHDVSEERGRFWPIAFGLMGALTLVDYFYKLSFQPDDLLQGVGFLLIVPLAYFSPAAFSNPFKRRRSAPHVSAWSRWLGRVGILLVITGLIVEWL